MVAIAEHLGFEYRKTVGSHMTYVKKGCPRPIVIPRYTLKGEHVQRALIKTAGIDRQRFLELKDRFS